MSKKHHRPALMDIRYQGLLSIYFILSVGSLILAAHRRPGSFRASIPIGLVIITSVLFLSLYSLSRISYEKIEFLFERGTIKSSVRVVFASLFMFVTVQILIWIPTDIVFECTDSGCIRRAIYQPLFLHSIVFGPIFELLTAKIAVSFDDDPLPKIDLYLTNWWRRIQIGFTASLAAIVGVSFALYTGVFREFGKLGVVTFMFALAGPVAGVSLAILYILEKIRRVEPEYD